MTDETARNPAPGFDTLKAFVVPASFAQQRLWFLDQLAPGSPAYNIGQLMRIRAPIDPATVERSLQEIGRRHEVLRTTFASVDGRPLQVVSPEQALSLTRIDLSEFAPADRYSEAIRIQGEAIRVPFDLASGPLLRLSLIELAKDDQVLLLTMHHIVGDGWSLGVFFRELAALYEAFSSGRSSPLPALPIQYADYSAWQQESLQGQRLDGRLSYWTRQLAGLPTLELPGDRARPPVQTFRSGRRSVVLPTPLAETLKAVAQKEGASLYMALLAAFQTLLSRHSGQDDVIVGSPIAERNRTETEPLIGFFVNTLVLRTDLSDEPTFRELLRRVRKVVLDAFTHEVPFEKLVEALRPTRDLSRTPLFQVLFNMLNFDVPKVRIAGAWVEPIEVPPKGSLFDLTLYGSEAPDGLRFWLVYNADLFEGDRMTELLEQFSGLLDQIASAPDARIGSYSLVTPAARRLLPDPTAPIEEPETGVAADEFLRWSERTPDAAAVAGGGCAWTYRELEERSRAIAERLLADGLSPGDVVAVTGPRSPGFIAGMLGVVRSGGVLLTLDSALPAARRALMISEANTRRMIDVAGAADAAAAGPSFADGTGSVPALPVDRDGRPVSTEAAGPAPRLPRVSGNDPAYVFFTSGSTGVPRAILGTHKGLAHFLRWERETFEVGPVDRCSQLTGVSFDVVLRDVFLPLTSGASLHLPDADEEAGSSRIVSWLDREAITILHAVPSVVLSWLADPPADAPLARLRRAFFAGEPLTDTLVRRWRSAFPEAGEIVNLYGPTETTLAKCFYVVPSDAPAGIQPVGYPLPDTQVLVLADGARLCGVGEVGEIVLRTPFRTLGYLNAPREQRERFVPNPFRSDPRDLLYRTGDIGRYRLDGSVAILGRRDDQVKIRGVRVEPAEVAAVLSAHSRVAACVVVSRTDGHGETTLVAYVVAAGGEAVSVDELRTHTSSRLPAAMIPSAIGFLNEIPLTPNGKLDRAALPPVVPSERRAPLELPATPLEEIVAAIWSAVLGVGQVSLAESFFELGGHSLNATQVLSRVNQAFGLDLRIRTLFENPVLAAFSSAVEAALSRKDEIAPPLLEPKETSAHSDVPLPRRRDPEAPGRDAHPGSPPDTVRFAPVSFAQQRLWFLDQLDPGLGFYNIRRAYRLRGNLDVEAVERALRTMEERHEALRTVFAVRDDEPVQVVTLPGRARLAKVDLSGVPPDSQEAKATRYASEEAQRPFDLARGPLFRASLLKLNDRDHVLVLAVHHAVFDGWSVEVFERELGGLYGAYREGLPSPLAELPAQYADFAIWQREWLDESGSVSKDQLTYWKKQLGGAPAVLDLSVSRLRPARQTFRGASESVVLGKAVSEAMRRLGRAEKATLFMTLLAAFQVLLLRHSGQDDILVGSPVAGRNSSEIEGLIGLFVNTLVFRTDLSGDPSFRQLLSRVRNVAIEAYAHQDLPFEKLVEDLNPERTQSYSPVFQVMMNYRNAPPAGPQLAGVSVSAIHLEQKSSKYDLTAFFENAGHHIAVSFEYNSDLFAAETIARMLSHLEVLLDAIVQDPDRPLSELPMLTPEERHRVLVEWNDTANDDPPQLLHRPFEETAHRTPEAVAVEAGNRRLTYGHLNQRANRLARHLAKLGVGPGVLVGLCVDRSIEAIVGMLGILKAGGAYLPLDPAYPRERLRFMLDDSGAHALLTLRPLAESVPTLAGRTLFLDDSRETIAREDESDFDSGAAPTDLAYVIYTSGSTGKPKGVEIEHREISNHVRFAAQRFGSERGDRVLQFASLSFDTSLQEVFPTLWGGATLVLRSQEMIESVAGFLARCREWALTVIDLPTAYWHELVAVASVEGLELPGPLRLVIIGGEAALPERFAQWEKLAAGRVRLINGYGPTEASVAATFWEPGPNAASSVGRAVPIGKPISNTRVYVVDGRMQPAPIGVAGDLLIGGVGVARGYRKRPDLTAERFIRDPFGGEEDRVYRTGDRARWLPSGELEYLGRVDGQIKLRGFRIELGEIEAALRAIPGVRDAVVRALQDPSGTARLVGWVVPAREDPPSIGDMRRRLKESLPEHMVPSAFMQLTALPRTPNGKLDSSALPVPEAVRPELDSVYCEPRTPVERALAKIWSIVLGIARVGVHDNFFELGGHSLLATRVVSRARDLFHLDLPLRELFARPTVADLASIVEGMLADRLVNPDPRAGAKPDRLTRREAAGNAPLSFAQQRLWFLDQLDPGRDFYNIARAYRLAGDLDAPALERAFRGVEARHEVLRTVFALTPDGPIQVVKPPGGVELSTVDLTDLPRELREREAIRLAEEQAQRPFDLSRGPLMRASLWKLGERDHLLAVTVHHVAFDGWSVDVFERELGQLYAAERAGESPSLPELPVQYGDFAVWQREWLKGEVLEEQLSYWKRQLKGAPTILKLSVSRPRPARQTFRGASASRMLSKALSESIRRLGQAEKATLFMTLMAAFQVFLLRHSGLEDIVVGSPVAGRNRSDVEGLIGFFVNTLVFRTDLSGDPSFREVLDRVRRVAIDAYAHQDVPFEKLVEELNPERTL
ncbi:MAG: amino acid adenylation domain-containing protein, partial [Acidobacteriota bacterium]